MKVNDKIRKLFKMDKSLKFGAAMPNNRFRTPIFRLSYPYLFEPSTYGDKPAFQISMLFDTELVDLSKLEKLVASVTKEKFGKKKPKTLKSPFHDGEEKEDTDGYGEGVIYASARSQKAPGVCSANREPLEEDDIKAGDYCRATINVFGYDNQSKGIAFGLNNVQKIMDGEAFGAVRPNAEDDFDDLEIEEDEEDEEDIAF